MKLRSMFALLPGLVWSCGLCLPAHGQIGGQTASNGPFTIDNFEDLNTVAGGVQRNWVPDIPKGISQPFQALPLAGAGLTQAAGQTPLARAQYSMATNQGYIDYSFGVPMPSVAGASTATNPGNISLFSSLAFLTRASTSLSNQKWQVLLQCYPETSPGSNVFPTLYWSYTLTPGTTFQPISIDLHAPSFVANAGTRTINQLLSQTRYMAFYYYAGPESGSKSLVVDIDDVRLTGTVPVTVSQLTIE